MTDTAASPVPPESKSNAAGWIIAIALLLGVAFFGIFVWPGLKGVMPRTPTHEGERVNINVQLPAGSIPSTSGPNIMPQTPDPSVGVQ